MNIGCREERRAGGGNMTEYKDVGVRTCRPNLGPISEKCSNTTTHTTTVTDSWLTSTSASQTSATNVSMAERAPSTESGLYRSSSSLLSSKCAVYSRTIKLKRSRVFPANCKINSLPPTNFRTYQLLLESVFNKQGIDELLQSADFPIVDNIAKVNVTDSRSQEQPAVAYQTRENRVQSFDIAPDHPKDSQMQRAQVNTARLKQVKGEAVCAVSNVSYAMPYQYAATYDLGPRNQPIEFPDRQQMAKRFTLQHSKLEEPVSSIMYLMPNFKPSKLSSTKLISHRATLLNKEGLQTPQELNLLPDIQIFPVSRARAERAAVGYCGYVGNRVVMVKQVLQPQCRSQIFLEMIDVQPTEVQAVWIGDAPSVESLEAVPELKQVRPDPPAVSQVIEKTEMHVANGLKTERHETEMRKILLSTIESVERLRSEMPALPPRPPRPFFSTPRDANRRVQLPPRPSSEEKSGKKRKVKRTSSTVQLSQSFDEPSECRRVLRASRRISFRENEPAETSK